MIVGGQRTTTAPRHGGDSSRNTKRKSKFAQMHAEFREPKNFHGIKSTSPWAWQAELSFEIKICGS